MCPIKFNLHIKSNRVFCSVCFVTRFNETYSFKNIVIDERREEEGSKEGDVQYCRTSHDTEGGTLHVG